MRRSEINWCNLDGSSSDSSVPKSDNSLAGIYVHVKNEPIYALRWRPVYELIGVLCGYLSPPVFRALRNKRQNNILMGA